MIAGLATLLLCQLAGEVVAHVLALPVPGPVIGMALLFGGLLLRDRLRRGAAAEAAALGRVADVLLGNLGLLFVPAGVGVVLYLPLLLRDWAPVTLAILLGTPLTIAATGWLAQWLFRRGDGPAA